jgi:hypothetical protein
MTHPYDTQNPPIALAIDGSTATPGSNAEEAALLLHHYTQWLEANGLLREPHVKVITKAAGSTDPAGVLMRRYMELQWGEDTENEWGHAFDDELGQ